MPAHVHFHIETALHSACYMPNPGSNCTSLQRCCLQAAAAEGASASEATRQQLAAHEAAAEELRCQLAAAQVRVDESAEALAASRVAAEAAAADAVQKQVTPLSWLPI